MDPEKKPSPAEAWAAHARNESILREICVKASEATEHELLMPIWQYLADHTSTYHLAFVAAQAFRDMDDGVEKALDRLPDNSLRCTLLETLGKVLIQRATCLREVVAKKEELQRKP